MKKFFTLISLAMFTGSVFADDYEYVTTSQISVNETTYYLTWGDASELTNNDTSGSWWDGATDTHSLAAGDFAVRFTWSNTRDINYSDVVAELYDSNSNYWDWTVGDASGWGTLQGNFTLVYTEDGEVADNVAPGTSNGEF